MRRASLFNRLEGLIDMATIDRVLGTMKSICLEKSRYIKRVYGDASLALSWERVGRKIQTAKDQAMREGL